MCLSIISRSRLRCLSQRTRREGACRSYRCRRRGKRTSRFNRGCRILRYCLRCLRQRTRRGDQSSKRTSRCYRLSRYCGCLNRFSVGRLILKRGLLLIRRFIHVRGLLCMLEFRGAFLLRNSTTGGGKGITLTKTARRNLLRKRGLRRQRTSRCLRGNLLRCLLGGALRNRGNLPRTQGCIHARGLGGVCAGQRLTVATPRILTAARTISQRRRLSGVRGSLLNGLLRRLRGNSRRNCRLRCGRTGRCGLSSRGRLSCGFDLLTGLCHLSVNGHLTAQELAHAGGQLGYKALHRA